MDYYAIGQRIRKIRKAYGISQEALAEQAGISITHMSHIETGNTKMSLPVLVCLANALAVRTDDLLFDQHPAQRSTALEEIIKSLDACSTQQLRVMEDLLRAVKLSLEKHY